MSMASPTPHGDPGASLSQLVDALNAMRDGLVQVSQLLQDYQLECDAVQREMATAQLNALLEKLTAR